MKTKEKSSLGYLICCQYLHIQVCFTKSLVSPLLTVSLMPKWQQIQHIPVIFDRTFWLVNYNRPIVFLFAASRSFESLLRMSEYFGNTSSLMCCVLGALHLVLGILLYVRVVAGVFFLRSVVQRKLACFQWKLGSHVVRSLTRLGAYSLTDIDCSFQYMCGIYCSKSSGVYWAGIFHVGWISERRFNYTCVCCIPPQFGSAWS